MQKEILYGLVGMLLGILITVFVASSSVNNNNQGMMRMMGMNTNKAMNETGDHGMTDMDEMVGSLQGKMGDDFDKAFILAMINHHQGAIDMADEAKKNAKHQEIKDLADDIIEAQTKEINQMRDWQKDWGY